jgi:hypothetical protein
LVIIGFSVSSFAGAENMPGVFASSQCVGVEMLCDDKSVQAAMPRGCRLYAQL